MEQFSWNYEGLTRGYSVNRCSRFVSVLFSPPPVLRCCGYSQAIYVFTRCTFFFFLTCSYLALVFAGELRSHVSAVPDEPLQHRVRAPGGFDSLRKLRDVGILPRDLLGVPAHHRAAVDAPCVQPQRARLHLREVWTVFPICWLIAMLSLFCSAFFGSVCLLCSFFVLLCFLWLGLPALLADCC